MSHSPLALLTANRLWPLLLVLVLGAGGCCPKTQLRPTPAAAAPPLVETPVATPSVSPAEREGQDRAFLKKVVALSRSRSFRELMPLFCAKLRNRYSVARLEADYNEAPEVAKAQLDRLEAALGAEAPFAGEDEQAGEGRSLDLGDEGRVQLSTGPTGPCLLSLY